MAQERAIKGFTVGDIKVTQIVESNGTFLPLAQMIPDATMEAIVPYRDWMVPWALDPNTGCMVLPVQSYLVETSHHRILIDTCVGNNKSSKFFPPWHNLESMTWLDNLAASDVSPEDVDYVLCTHLHFDHCGWNTRLIDGKWVPTFPNAQYLFAREEFARAEEKGGPALEENLAPIMDAGLGVIVDANHAIDEHVWLEPTFGHTSGHVAIHLESKGIRAVMIGDIMHSPVQCEQPDWHSIADDDPVAARLTRQRILETHCEAGTLVLTAHFPTPSIGRFVIGSNAYRFKCEDTN
jgi:glyoxylase-like metal-dependent hydrolase (beta-lactamase superfamily II)